MTPIRTAHGRRCHGPDSDTTAQWSNAPVPSDQPTPTDASDLDAEAFRKLGYAFVDAMASVLTSEGNDPVIPEMSGESLRRLLDEPLPRSPLAPEAVLAECCERIVPYGRRNGHPRFFAYVCASADPIGALADGLASMMNQNLTAWRSAPAAVELERVVVRWLDEMVGFGGGGSGLLVGGGSAANATALACAVRAKLDEHGDDARDRLTVYVSCEGHMSLFKAARWLGIADDHIRTVETDDRRRMNVACLSSIIDDDRRAGLLPMCVCASAGTVNTGAIDPLDEIADLCGAKGVWFHIDGAYGAPAAITREYAWMSHGFARADSLSLDPHKWLFAPLDVGCVLVRSDDALRRAFSFHAAYVEVGQTDTIEAFAFFDRGMELSRRFRALKVWMILKTRGVEGIARVIERNIALRKRLDERVAAEPCLEPLGSELSVACFRYRPEGFGDGDALNAINQRVVTRLVQEGRVYLSPTTLDGRFSLRACIVNFRTREGDIDMLVDEVLRVGGEEASGASRPG